MCGRYTVSKAQEVLAEYFDMDVSGEVHVPVFNASPTQLLPVVRNVEPKRIVAIRWGIRPAWSAAPSRLLINARSETAHRRSSFRESFRKRRCLVIADGFYEWQAGPSGKQPFRVVLKTGEPFAFAGIWDIVDGSPAFVILTTDANRVTRPIHERMPVILEPEERGAWLDSSRPLDQVIALLDPFPDDAIMAYRVSKAVNDSRNDAAGLIDPVE